MRERRWADMNEVALVFLLSPPILYMALRVLNWSADRFGEDLTVWVAGIAVWLGLTLTAASWAS